MDKLDDTDVRLLDLLQRDGRAKRTALAEAVGLSTPSVSDRMRKLEARGVLTGYHAAVDAKRLGHDVMAFVFVQSTGSEHYAAFVAGVAALDEVQELHSVTGDGSHVLKVRVRTTTALERLLATVQGLPGVRGTRTSLVLSTHKETTYLPAEPMTLAPTD
ncbi:Lrp/AsnC family transcriptional regulator [Rubrivirga sp. IMCC45206]|uniref:Lrp/AsnC family transcriptional regulator n=1 Tax=Rubrivirga sp. IMCC45206 TaxID=3391614 RepID=UPI00398F9795